MHDKSSTSIRFSFLLCTLVAAGTFWVYRPVLHYGFISFDDTLYVSENPHVKPGLSWEGLKWALGLERKNKTYWHPLTWLSHMLDCELFGLDSGRHHLTSLILHVANALLIFAVLNRMTGAVRRSICVAALFALHPLHVDSVAWIAERKNVLSTFFWLSTIWAYTAYVRHPGSGRYLWTCLLAAAGLMSKPMGITLPFALLLLDFWPLGRFGFERHPPPGVVSFNGEPRFPAAHSPVRLIVEKIPLLAMSLGVLSLAFFSLQRQGEMVADAAVPFGLRLANASVSYVVYLWKMVRPSELAVYYPFPQHIPPWQVAGAAGLLSGITIWVVFRMRSRPYLTVGWFWFAGTLVPVSGIVQAGNWPAMADRWAYVPSIGVFTGMVWLAGAVTERLQCRRTAAAVICVCLMTTLAIVARIQVGYWRSDAALYRHCLAVDPDNHLAHNNLGAALEAAGDVAAAERHYREALRLNPEYVEALNNMGNRLTARGDHPAAQNFYRKALAIDPDRVHTHINLGRLAAKAGDFSEAVRLFSRAAELNPDSADAHYNLGVALAARGDVDPALKAYERAVALDPDHIEAHNNLATLYAGMGRVSPAIEHFREALRIRPGDAVAAKNLEALYKTLR